MRLRHILATAAVTAGAAILAAGGVAAATAGDRPSGERQGQMMPGGQMRDMHRQMRDMHREHMRDPEMRKMHREHMRDPEMRKMHREHMRDPEMRRMHREMMSMGSMMGSTGSMQGR
jgi:hypothetical protein